MFLRGIKQILLLGECNGNNFVSFLIFVFISLFHWMALVIFIVVLNIVK
jgi:hypothetical protein